MAKFEIKRVTIVSISDHANAQKLTVAQLSNGAQVVINKTDDGHFRYAAGQPGIFIPDNAILKRDHLQSWGYWNTKEKRGYLSGENFDRVKPVTLRGEVSEGLFVAAWVDHDGSLASVIQDPIGKEYIKWEVWDIEPPATTWYTNHLPIEDGVDYSVQLGIVKYFPPIPEDRIGFELSVGNDVTVPYDVEDFKKVKEYFKGEATISEKLHGTFVEFVYYRDEFVDHFIDGHWLVASKNLANVGKIFAPDVKNIYMDAFHKHRDDLDQVAARFSEQGASRVAFFGEIYGPGVQDLHYDATEKQFRLFDIKVDSKFLEDSVLWKIAADHHIPVVPPIGFTSVFDTEELKRIADLPSILGGGIREGIVLKSRQDPSIRGKVVSAKYVGRKGKTTDYN